MTISDRDRLLVLNFIEDNEGATPPKVAHTLKFAWDKIDKVLRDLEDRDMIEWQRITLDDDVDYLRVKAAGRDFMENNSTRWKKILSLLPQEIKLNFSLVNLG